MVHKLDTLMIYIQPNQLIQAIHTSNLTKHLNHYLMTLCLKKFKCWCSELPYCFLLIIKQTEIILEPEVHRQRCSIEKRCLLTGV